MYYGSVDIIIYKEYEVCNNGYGAYISETEMNSHIRLLHTLLREAAMSDGDYRTRCDYVEKNKKSRNTHFEYFD